MLRHLFKSKKMKRKEANAAAVMPIYFQAASTLPADYLARNQRDPERAAKVLTKAHEQRLAKNARRLKHAEASGQRRPVFKLDLRKAS